MACPQPEPFVKFSIELLEAVIASPMPATHKEVFLAVVCLTYGNFGKKDARISHKKLQELTCRARSTVADAVSDLIQERVLLEVEPRAGSRAARLGIQKNYEAWGRFTPRNGTETAHKYRCALPQKDRPALRQDDRRSGPPYIDRRMKSDPIEEIPDIHVPEGVLA